MRFLVHGSVAYDQLLGHDGSFVDGIDPKNLKSLSVGYVAQRYARHHGGTAANIAWNLRLLGHTPVVVGTVGNDGGPYLELLRERGVDTTYIQTLDDCLTATAIIATDNAAHQITFFYPGADAKGTLPSLADERDDVAYAIVAPRDASTMLAAARQSKKDGIPFLFDPGQQSLQFGRDEFRAAVAASNGLIVNAYEWALATARLEWNADKVVEECGLLVVTQGENGATLQSAKEIALVKACPPDRLVNPVGAGDAFRAGLLMGLAKKWSLTDSGRLGAVLGSLVVAQEGALLESLDVDDVRNKAQAAYGEELPKF
ncbi:MAG TPA: carbohydrate kinase family protein [Candidatus Peribacteria bacterium]|nr:carbohydrate kinase family protein [Candidatus Peribacteria bacterium]